MTVTKIGLGVTVGSEMLLDGELVMLAVEMEYEVVVEINERDALLVVVADVDPVTVAVTSMVVVS